MVVGYTGLTLSATRPRTCATAEGETDVLVIVWAPRRKPTSLCAFSVPTGADVREGYPRRKVSRDGGAQVAVSGRKNGYITQVRWQRSVNLTAAICCLTFLATHAYTLLRDMSE